MKGLGIMAQKRLSAMRFSNPLISFLVAIMLAVALVIGVMAPMASPAFALGPDAVRSGFDTNTLPANDDLSTGLESIGMELNFYGNTYDHLYVNNNGNVTFDQELWTYTPFDLTSTGRVIIAPFFADVDTRVGNVVTYGSGTVDGRTAFGVNWIGVGYYDQNIDKLNDFQLVLIDRSDIAVGDFDIEFNYDRIEWETGDASDGSGGLGGDSARVGYSNGTGEPGTYYEFPGSAVNGAFLDSNLDTGLIHGSLNSTQLGRYVLRVRSGTVEPPIEETCVDLVAGQHTVVGSVCVIDDGNEVTVAYRLNDDAITEGWVLSETHLHVGDTLDDFPLNRDGNPRIGHFANAATHDPGVTEYSYVVPLGDLDGEILIAAHADVTNVDLLAEEGAWGDGDRFVEQGNWAMYFPYMVGGEE
jgi:hypothetical protein